MKNLKNCWFTLIEIIIATTILTISVFWVYKLIWENTKLISNFDSFKKSESLFTGLEQCINNLWFENFKLSKEVNYNFNFWADNNSCLTWSINKVYFDNIDYNLIWNITDSWSNFINWNLEVFSENNWKLTKNYIQLK